MKTIMLAMALWLCIAIVDGCTGATGDDYVCIRQNNARFYVHRNSDEMHRKEYLEKYLTADLKYQKLEIRIPKGLISEYFYKFEFSQCRWQDQSQGNMIISECTVDSSTLDKATMVMKSELTHGGTFQGGNVHGQDVTIRHTFTLPQICQNNNADVTLRATVKRDWPIWFSEKMNMNINNFTQANRKHSDVHTTGSQGAVVTLRFGGLMEFHLQIENGIFTTSKKIMYGIETARWERRTFHFWRVWASVYKEQSVYWTWQGTEADQSINQKIFVRRGHWLDGNINMKGLLAGIIVASVLGVLLVIGAIIACVCYCKCKEKKEREEAERAEKEAIEATVAAQYQYPMQQQMGQEYVQPPPGYAPQGYPPMDYNPNNTIANVVVSEPGTTTIITV